MYDFIINMDFLLKILRAVFDTFLDFLFPKKCLGCGKNDVLFCSSCEGLILKSSLSLRFDDLEIFIAASPSPLFRDVLHQLKYGYSEGLAVILGLFLRERFLNEQRFFMQNLPDFVAVPVPLHWKRFNDRGFNQSELLARQLPIPVIPLLRRHRATSPQVKLSREQREKNVSNAFSFVKNARLNLPLLERVLLIDDVFTTGATIAACAKVLKMAGVKEVKALVLTHGI